MPFKKGSQSTRYKRSSSSGSPVKSQTKSPKRKRGRSATTASPKSGTRKGSASKSPAPKRSSVRYPSNRGRPTDCSDYSTVEKTKKGSEKKALSKSKKNKDEIADIIHAKVLSDVIGDVLTMGQGNTGQLGLGPDTFEKCFPGVVKDADGNPIENVISVVAGGMHSLCLTLQGQVFSFGCNDEGALGRKTADEDAAFIPDLVENLSEHKIVQITAGDSHSMFLSDKGIVFGTGTFRDANGIIGLVEKYKIEKTPVQIMMPCHTRIQKIASGLDHLVCLTIGGQIITTGCADQGQLGRVFKMQASSGGRRGLKALLTPSFIRISRRSTLFSNIWTGQYCTYAKALNKNEIWACGLNNYYQIGFPNIESRYNLSETSNFTTEAGANIISITGGQHHAIALDSKKNVYSIGRPDYGRLGLGQSVDIVLSPTRIPNLKNVSSISADTAVSYAISNGELYAWGMGSNNQLGGKEDDDVIIPRKVTGKQITPRFVLNVSAGGQHVVICAKLAAQ